MVQKNADLGNLQTQRNQQNMDPSNIKLREKLQNRTDQRNNFHPTHSLTKQWVPKHPSYPQNNSKIHQQSLQPQPPSSPLSLPTKSTKESHQTQHITINQINTKHATFDSSLFSFRNPNTPSMLVHQPTISSSLHLSQIDSYLEDIADKILGKAPPFLTKKILGL